MINLRTSVFASVIAAALISLSLPALAVAQGGYDPWYRGGRDRDYGRRDDRYERRGLRDAVRRVESRSKDFERSVDRSLDRGRYDGSRREDRINEVANEFHDAANRLKDRFDDGRNLDRSAGEARTLLQLGRRIDSLISRTQLDSRTYSIWSGIRQDLQQIAYAYNFNSGGYNDDYRRDDDYRRRGRYERRGSNSPWGILLPRP